MYNKNLFCVFSNPGPGVPNGKPIRRQTLGRWGQQSSQQQQQQQQRRYGGVSSSYATDDDDSSVCSSSKPPSLSPSDKNLLDNKKNSDNLIDIKHLLSDIQSDIEAVGNSTKSMLENDNLRPTTFSLKSHSQQQQQQQHIHVSQNSSKIEDYNQTENGQIQSKIENSEKSQNTMSGLSSPVEPKPPVPAVRSVLGVSNRTTARSLSDDTNEKTVIKDDQKSSKSENVLFREVALKSSSRTPINEKFPPTEPQPLLSLKSRVRKTSAPVQPSNSMVFNFVNSNKDVTHIENDGLDMSKRRIKIAKVGQKYVHP